MLHVPFLQLVQILTHPDDAWDVEKTDSTGRMGSVLIVIRVDIVLIMVKIMVLVRAKLAVVVSMLQADQPHAQLAILVNIQVQLLHRVQIVILVNILVRGLRLQTLLLDLV